jgi:hypothetical protein
MQSASTTAKRFFSILFLSGFVATTALSQDNSPWSRYGLGDLMPSVNIASRGMGHTAAAYSDMQTINFINPASYSKFGMQRSILDVGIDINNRTISNNRGASYSSANAYIPYLAGGFQLKGEKSKTNWGLAFGLRPLTKVSYNIETGQKIPAGDSIIYNYEGNGGTYQAFLGTAIGIKNFSIGVNGGYRFGSKDYTTRAILLNDTAPSRYTSGQKIIRNNFGGAFLEAGIQYQLNFDKKTALHLGAYGSIQTPMNATRDELYESYFLAGEAGNPVRIDSVSETRDIKGKIQYPSYYGFGILFDRVDKGRLNVALDYVLYNWREYRYYGGTDFLQNSWQVKAGAQYLPNVSGTGKTFWSNVLYRAGFHVTREPFIIDGNMNSYGFTLGAGLPIRKFSYAEINRSNVVNAALEMGQRSNRNSLLRENYFRLAVSFSLSDIWFIKRKYD